MIIIIFAVLALVMSVVVLTLCVVAAVMDPVVGLFVVLPMLLVLWWGLRRLSAGVRLRHAMQIRPFDPNERY